MITGAAIMGVGVLLGAIITFRADKNKPSDGPNMTVVKNVHPASSDD